MKTAVNDIKMNETRALEPFARLVPECNIDESSAQLGNVEPRADGVADNVVHNGASIESDYLFAVEVPAASRICEAEMLSEHRARLLDCAWKQNDAVGLFCLVLIHTGCRISEALALRWMDIEATSGTIVIRSLQQRGVSRIRYVPAPQALIKRLLDRRTASSSSFDEKIWTWSRVTAWRRMRDIFAKAKITGILATPKGLRSSFARTALSGGVPREIVCRWLGVSYLKVDCRDDRNASPDDTPWKDILWREPVTSHQDTGSIMLSPVRLAST